MDLDFDIATIPATDGDTVTVGRPSSDRHGRTVVAVTVAGPDDGTVALMDAAGLDALIEALTTARRFARNA